MTLLERQREMRAWLVDSLVDVAIDPRTRAGLDVYQNNYRAQLVASLSETYTRVKLWLGDDAFLASITQHIRATPPNGWTLDQYGSDFPRTLSTLYPNDREIEELAWLDRALTDVFIAADAKPLQSSHLSAVDWDRAVLRLTPTLKSREMTTNAAALWSALTAGEHVPAVEILAQPSTLLLWRKGFMSFFRSIESTEAAALALIREGASFAFVCERLTSMNGHDGGVRLAGELLAQWLRDELIVGVDE